MQFVEQIELRICLSKILIFLRKDSLWGHPCLQPCHAEVGVGGAISIIEDQYLVMSREKILFPFYSRPLQNAPPCLSGQALQWYNAELSMPSHCSALQKNATFFAEKCTAMHDNAAPHFLTLGLWHCICYCRRIWTRWWYCPSFAQNEWILSCTEWTDFVLHRMNGSTMIQKLKQACKPRIT